VNPGIINTPLRRHDILERRVREERGGDGGERGEGRDEGRGGILLLYFFLSFLFLFFLL
jgi:hypothetical protein